MLDSVADIVASVQRTAQHMQLPYVKDAVVREGIGLSSAEQIVRLYGDGVDLSEFRQNFERFYFENSGENTTPSAFEGAEALLHQALKYGYSLAISTGKGRAGLDAHLQALGWQDLFSVTCCADEFESKPSPKMLAHISNVLSCDLSDLMMVGDSQFDLLMAQNAGAQYVGVLTGVGDREQLGLYEPLLLLDSVSDLKGYLVNRVSE